MATDVHQSHRQRVLAERTVYGFGLVKTGQSARLVLAWPRDESRLIAREELEHHVGDGYHTVETEWRVKEEIVLDPTAFEHEGLYILEPSYSTFDHRLVLEWHEDAPRENDLTVRQLS